MALSPNDSIHALQIQAGITGRHTGHKFETSLTNSINALQCPIKMTVLNAHLIYDDAATALIQKTLNLLNWNECHKIEAIALGSLATAEEGKKWLEVKGVKIRACKSDILITLYKDNLVKTVGISVKQCSKSTPTNAQLYFTTARAFGELLRKNQIETSDDAVTALRQFCGDKGFRPLDNPTDLIGRVTDPRRYFWEEINEFGRLELEKILTNNQHKITRLLLQKAYIDDPFTPEILLHRTKKVLNGQPQEFAIYTIDELVELSYNYCKFEKKKYSVRKGSYKDPEGVQHDAPRFGIVQMQRGGQTQHPEQLQFNLQAGYFYNI
jgi:hypothetical protein